MDNDETGDNQHEAIREQLGAYAFGDLSPAEHALVRDHLATCAACRAELADLRAALAALPLVLEELTPPASLRDRIEASVLADLAATGTAGGAAGAPPAPAAAASLTGTSLDSESPPPRAEDSATRNRVGWPATDVPAGGWGPPADEGRRIDDSGSFAAPAAGPAPAPGPGIAPPPAPIPLRPSRRGNAGWLAAAALLLLSLGLFGWNIRLREEAAQPPATVVAIVPQPTAPGASGEVRVDPTENLLVLDVAGLPPLGEGEVYQAWLLGPDADSPPTPAGTFSTPDARHAISADLAAGWTGVAITAEPGPLGSPQPTTDIVAVAEFSAQPGSQSG